MSWIADKLAKIISHDGPVITTRAADSSVFQPNANKASFCSYTIQQVAAHGNDGTVKLLSDAVNPPTTERDQCRLAVTDDAAGVTICKTLRYIVPAGHYVKLVAAGTGTPTITQQFETPLS